MQRPFENLNVEDRRVYRDFVGGVFAVYAAALAIVIGLIVDHQVTKATARNAASSLSAQSTPSADVQAFRQAVKHD